MVDGSFFSEVCKGVVALSDEELDKLLEGLPVDMMDALNTLAEYPLEFLDMLYVVHIEYLHRHSLFQRQKIREFRQALGLVEGDKSFV